MICILSIYVNIITVENNHFRYFLNCCVTTYEDDRFKYLILKFIKYFMNFQI